MISPSSLVPLKGMIKPFIKIKKRRTTTHSLLLLLLGEEGLDLFLVFKSGSLEDWERSRAMHIHNIHFNKLGI